MLDMVSKQITFSDRTSGSVNLFSSGRIWDFGGGEWCVSGSGVAYLDQFNLVVHYSFVVSSFFFVKYTNMCHSQLQGSFT